MLFETFFDFPITSLFNVGCKMSQKKRNEFCIKIMATIQLIKKSKLIEKFEFLIHLCMHRNLSDFHWSRNF